MSTRYGVVVFITASVVDDDDERGSKLWEGTDDHAVDWTRWSRGLCVGDITFLEQKSSVSRGRRKVNRRHWETETE